jgi:hypothetical protein
MKWANERGLGPIVTELLEDQSKQLYEPVGFVLLWTIEKGLVSLLKLLLQDSRIDPSIDDNASLRLACENNLVEMVQVLLAADPRVDPSVDDQFLLRYACEHGLDELVKLLLADKRVDPAVWGNTPLQLSCAHGHTEVVKLLLADERVDPCVGESSALRFACENDQAEVVKVLLEDKRVDPAADHNIALRLACSRGCVNVVKLLLADQRVDPSEDPSVLSQAMKDGFVEVVKLLLSDERVLLPSPPSSYFSSLTSFSSVDILALVLLRQSIRLEFLKEKHRLLYTRSGCSSVLVDLKQIEAQRKVLFDAHLLSDLSLVCLAYVPDFFCCRDVLVSSLTEPNRKAPHFTFDSLCIL